jgi:TolB protein
MINGGPAWSPDGNAILYSHYPDLGPTQLWIFSTQSRTTRYLGPGHSGAWSPDGEKIVYDSGGATLWIFDLRSEERFQLTNFGASFQPRWSPDGKRILFMRWDPSEELWTMAADGSDLQDLGVPWNNSADWSPKGDAIVFGNDLQLMTMKMNDGAPDGAPVLLVSVASARCRYPRWSPDGEWIAYYRWNEGVYELWLIRPDGRDNHRLIEWARQASWSPDAKRLVYEHRDRRANTIDLWLFSIESGRSWRLFR